jgi:DNA-directed RNA polymerase subunit RPC12/RpoP
MEKIKAIQTEYNGYLFRSKLEAHWAVFFDELGLDYLYEPEGFQLEEHNYLPDFLFPEGFFLYDTKKYLKKIWLEVKPVIKIRDREQEKIYDFVNQTGFDLILLSGSPGIKSAKCLWITKNDEQIIEKKVKFLMSPTGKLGLISEDFFSGIIGDREKQKIKGYLKFPKLLAAYKKSKQYRFDGTGRKNSNFTKKCKDCGEEFTAYKNTYIFCKECYFKRLHSEMDTGEDPHSDTNTSGRHVNWSKVLVAFLFLIMIGGAVYFIAFKNSPVDSSDQVSDVTQTPVCNCESNIYDCVDFKNQTSAQECYEFCFSNYGDVHKLDMDEDGLVCETLNK